MQTLNQLHSSAAEHVAIVETQKEEDLLSMKRVCHAKLTAAKEENEHLEALMRKVMLNLSDAHTPHRVTA